MYDYIPHQLGEATYTYYPLTHGRNQNTIENLQAGVTIHLHHLRLEWSSKYEPLHLPWNDYNPGGSLWHVAPSVLMIPVCFLCGKAMYDHVWSTMYKTPAWGIHDEFCWWFMGKRYEYVNMSKCRIECVGQQMRSTRINQDQPSLPWHEGVISPLGFLLNIHLQPDSMSRSPASLWSVAQQTVPTVVTATLRIHSEYDMDMDMNKWTS